MSDPVAELLSTLPKSIHVGPFAYTLEVIDNLKEGGEEHWGLCIHNKQKIQIAGEHATPQAAVDTLLHEIMHAIWKERGLAKREPEERAVQAMATGLTCVLLNNPALLAWMREGLKQ